jgi:hypothetical protein
MRRDSSFMAKPELVRHERNESSPHLHKAPSSSFNWSPSAAHQNDEVLLVIHSPLVAHFTREMDCFCKGAELAVTERLAREVQQEGEAEWERFREAAERRKGACPRAHPTIH